MLMDFAIAVIMVFFLILLWITYTRIFGAEWVKMPKTARAKMLAMLNLNKKDIFYDLGCGDGQLLLEASPRVKQAIGFEIDIIRYAIARIRTRNKNNIKIIYGNLFKKQLNKATKIAVFLSPETNIKLGKKLKQKFNSKTLIASYKWPVPSLKSNLKSNLKLIKYDDEHRIYLCQTNKQAKNHKKS